MLVVLVLLLGATTLGCREQAPDCIEGPGAGVALEFTGKTSERGDSASVSAVLTAAPESDVTLTFNTLGLAPGVSADRSSLTFTAADWDQPQVIRLVATNDGVRNPGPETQNTVAIETVETEDKRFDCAAGFVVFPHEFRHCKDGSLDPEEGEQCEPPVNDLGISVVDLRCNLGEATCERCDDGCQVVPGEFRAVCGDGRVTDVERCEPGETQPCTAHGFDRGTVTCLATSCQWDTTDCRNVTESCQTVEDSCTDCLVTELRHTCVKASDGRATCWGANENGQADPPADKRFTQVVDTGPFSCGLEANGAATCWGLSMLARNKPGPFVELVAGGGHVCGRKQDGTAECWGENGKGQSSVPEGRKFKAIAAGRWHSCGITTTDETVCWGRLTGELGRVPEGETFVGLGLGQHRSCGLRADGTVKCWGGGAGCVEPGGTFRSLTGGPKSICGLRTDGTIHCWVTPWDLTSRELPDVTAIALAGNVDRHCLLTESGEISCFGGDRPKLGALVGPFVALGVGSGGVCGVKADGKLACVDDLDTTSPGTVRQPLQGTFAEVALNDLVPAGGCARRADGRVQCWEMDAPVAGAYRQVSVQGLVGCGVRDDDSVGCWGARAGEFEMPEFDSFSRVSVGRGLWACGVRVDGSLLCFGAPEYLNFGGRFDFTPPTGSFLDVSSGGDIACAIGDDGTSESDGPVTCWGSPWSGVTDEPAGRFKKVVAGQSHACGWRVDGRVVCWGQPNFRERGDTATTLPPVGAFEELKVGDAHGCARRGDAWTCWGDDGWSRATPPERRYSSLAIGDEIVCAVTAEGQGSCWFPGGRVSHDWFNPAPLQYSAGAGKVCRLQSNGGLDCASSSDQGHRGPFTKIAMGPTGVCGIRSTPGVIETDGNFRCFSVGEGPGGTSGSVGRGYHPFIALDVGSSLTCFVNHEFLPQCQGLLSGLGEPPEALRLKTVSVEAGRVCGVTTTDTLGCWGRAETGRPDGAPIRDVQLSYGHGCVLTRDGAIQCWGNDPASFSSLPGNDWAKVGVGTGATCALDTSGRLACRGWLRR